MDLMNRAAAALVIALLAGCDSAPPGPPPVGTKPLPPARVRVQHVLIAFKGAREALPRVTRTREEAEVLANEIDSIQSEHPSDLVRAIDKRRHNFDPD